MRPWLASLLNFRKRTNHSLEINLMSRVRVGMHCVWGEQNFVSEVCLFDIGLRLLTLEDQFSRLFQPCHFQTHMYRWNPIIVSHLLHGARGSGKSTLLQGLQHVARNCVDETNIGHWILFPRLPDDSLHA